MIHAAAQLWRFGWNQALSCLFPAVIFGALALTKAVDLPWLGRYDWLLLVCLAAQAGMLLSGLETKDELKVITAFHLIGLALELFKVRMGSWSYPEEAYTKVFGVPLYSGFMYASVGSYLCQAWRRFSLNVDGWPRPYVAVPLGAAIYLNFFWHHYIWDLRWYLTAALFFAFGRTVVSFRVGDERYRMPMVVSFALIGFFIWLAENITTFLGAWQYPDQRDGWQLVHLGKFSSWFLLVVVSVLIVGQLKVVKAGRRAAVGADGREPR
ncbi:DUF817 domain-containing protein [Paenibacillus thermoaerophilus]|uniref:DUF817 domain-containing protein n=1 Tax=Paenibacillus thermoaerophilus TaxID=1215385 RepID=A0ABW2V4H5_9BACL|nr:DUF817 domain-containing protein [Paenibacillus thermoaerophilus]TMV15969.1 DUF817 domain-containing protein [Paenibacillus thermoaerophilus]